jgi:Flp pilus assembly protein protease CpaA
MLKLFHDPALQTQDLTILILLIVALAVAVVVELRTRRIPNWLTLTMLVISIGVAAWDGRWSGHFSAFVFAAILGVGGFVIGWWPGGIGKLAIAIGALGGIMPALAALAACFGICTLLMYLYRNDEETREYGRYIHGSPALAGGTLIGLGVQMLLVR